MVFSGFKCLFGVWMEKWVVSGFVLKRHFPIKVNFHCFLNFLELFALKKTLDSLVLVIHILKGQRVRCLDELKKVKRFEW